MQWNDFVQPFRHDLQREGYTLRYIDMGSGEPVFLLHGFASSTYCWNKNVKALSDAGFRTVVVDLPGQGQTDVPPESFDPRVENVAGEVLALADHLGIDRFSAVGASMGGGLTLFLSWNHADRVIRSVVIDPACFDQEKPWYLGLFTSPVVGSALAQFAGRWSVKSSLLDTVYDDDMVDDVFVDEYARPMAKPGYKAFLARLMDRFFSDRFREMSESYDRIGVPMLILWGLEDKWVPPEFGPRLNALVPDSRYVGVEKCGHMPHLEKPEFVNPLLVEFLRPEPAPEPEIDQAAPAGEEAAAGGTAPDAAIQEP